MKCKAPAIVLDNVSVAYAKGLRFFSKNKTWAIQDLTLEISHGETLGFLGRNGAGKSTLLKLLAGMVQPDKGRVLFDVGRVSLLALQVGFIEHLNGRDNVVLSAMFMGMSKKEIMEKMDSLISFSGIAEYIDKPVSTYSAGMKARLGFSVAFHVDADVILVDEVIAVGDAEFKKAARLAMREKIISGKAAVIVSHDFALLKEWCDRLVWIDKGRVVKMGDPDEVISEYCRKLKL